MSEAARYHEIGGRGAVLGETMRRALALGFALIPASSAFGLAASIVRSSPTAVRVTSRCQPGGRNSCFKRLKRDARGNRMVFKTCFLRH
jgi:hypothetical protein